MSNFIQEINAQQKGKLMFLGAAVKRGWRGQLWSCWEVPPAPTSNQQYPPAPTSSQQHPPALTSTLLSHIPVSHLGTRQS